MTARAIVVVLSAFVLLPLLWLMSVALRPVAEFFQAHISLLPAQPTLDAFARLFAPGHLYRAALENAVLMSLLAALATVALGVPSAYALVRSRGHNKMAAALGMTLISARFLPTVTLLPGAYWLLAETNSLDRVVPITLMILPSALALTILLFAPAVATIVPQEFEQAFVEGAPPPLILSGLVLPRLAPYIAIVASIAFALVWNEFLVVSFLSSTERSATTTSWVGNTIGQFRIDYPLLAAGGLLSLVPAIVVSAVMWTVRSSLRRRHPRDAS